mmetsp:Transcript_28042/g.43732  ORF Transcript_28042/g.43732 Transcript_28042/m.43732 type:complete len:134 (-) Transcript_28042:269-670(-)
MRVCKPREASRRLEGLPPQERPSSFGVCFKSCGNRAEGSTPVKAKACSAHTRMTRSEILRIVEGALTVEDIAPPGGAKHEIPFGRERTKLVQGNPGCPQQTALHPLPTQVIEESSGAQGDQKADKQTGEGYAS